MPVDNVSSTYDVLHDVLYGASSRDNDGGTMPRKKKPAAATCCTLCATKQGSIWKRDNDRYTAYYRPATGPKVTIKGTFATPCEAREVSVKATAHARGGAATSLSPAEIAAMTIEQFYDRYFTKGEGRKLSTLESYDVHWRLRIQPFIGSRLIRTFDELAVVDWNNVLKEKGYSQDTRRNTKIVLSAIISDAIAKKIRKKSDGNPCAAVELPDAKKNDERWILLPSEVSPFINAFPTHGLRLMTLTGFNTGARYGELAALEVRDFNFDLHTVTIQRVLTEPIRRLHPMGGGCFIVDSPKSGKPRTVDVPEYLCERLAKWCANNGLSGSDKIFSRGQVLPHAGRRGSVKEGPELTPEFIATLGFTDPVGPNARVYPHGTVNGYLTGKCPCEYCLQASREYDRARRGRRVRGGDTIYPCHYEDGRPAGVDACDHIGNATYARFFRAAADATLVDWPADAKATPHLMRHTFASQLIEQGFSLVTIMNWLGHSDPRMTIVYTHPVRRDVRIGGTDGVRRIVPLGMMDDLTE